MEAVPSEDRPGRVHDRLPARVGAQPLAGGDMLDQIGE
jgi:hypothetical protein